MKALDETLGAESESRGEEEGDPGGFGDRGLERVRSNNTQRVGSAAMPWPDASPA